MIDATDTSTRTLPGLPVVPPKPPKLSAAQRLAGAGYEGPKARWGCGNCKHGTEGGSGRGDVRCTLLEADTRRGGCCRRWEAAK